MDFQLTSSSFQLKYLVASVGFIIIFRLLGVPTIHSLLLCLGVAMLASFSYSGLEISHDHKESRHYVDILGWRMGTWQALPPVLGVTVKYFSAVDMRSKRIEELVIMLSVTNSRQGLIVGRASVDNMQETLDEAQRIAQAFSVSVNTYLPANLSS